MDKNEISDSAIALLCEIAGSTAEAASAEQQTHLHELLAGGYVEAEPGSAGAGGSYRLTAKAMNFLAMRGVGLNEA